MRTTVLSMFAVSFFTLAAQAQEAGRPVLRFATVQALRAAPGLQAGDWAETVGFRTPGDGGGALYAVQAPAEGVQANDADVLALENGLVAVLTATDHVNYRMFGPKCDGEADDGVQIKLAHEYAGRHGVPVINLSGEFWIKQAKAIPITTPVQWGKSVFHVDERFNDRSIPRFSVNSELPPKELVQDEALKAALIEKLKPGAQIIPELAPYAGHLFSVLDANDRIGIRAGYQGNRGWAREELFYVEEEGRVIGDIAWEFKDLTSIVARPCDRNYLVIEGGGFYFSGDSAEGGRAGYYQNGIRIQRSRTIIREQWMGLEPGKRDVSPQPRSGFYTLGGVYDVTLENIRAMPWEKNRRAPETPVPEGTYGISGARMLNCTFRNITAEAGPVAWGFFGTNLNKSFRIENCRLNRVDVHFHCWNLYIDHCTIGFKGITMTGGGELVVTDTTHLGNSFINFRSDYGAKWDGPIRLRGCTLKPIGTGSVSVLNMRPSNFDYQYPIGFGTNIAIEDLRIDYGAVPDSTAPCWLMEIASFSKNRADQRLFFPQRLTFRDITVAGREQGVRLMRIPNPYDYDVRRDGGCDESRLRPNCDVFCERVQLERIAPERPGTDQAHLVIGGENAAEYADARALYPRVVFTDCDNVSLYLGQCAASVFLERCSVNTVTARNLRGELSFSNCRLQPEVRQAEGPFYALDATLGTRFTSCSIHAPIVDGKVSPDLVDGLGFLEINKSLKYSHLNTSLGGEVLSYLKEKGTALTPEFIGQLRSHSGME